MNKRLSILRFIVFSGLLVNLFGCFQRETINVIVPGVVLVEPKSNTQDSLIFSEIRRFPEVSIIEMNQFHYQKQMTVPIDSTYFYNKYIIDLKLPFFSSLYPVPFLNSGNSYSQRFRCNLINLDTVDQNRWLFVLDSLGYTGYSDTLYKSEIKLLVPINQEMEYSVKLQEFQFVKDAYPELERKEITRSFKLF